MGAVLEGTRCVRGGDAAHPHLDASTHKLVMQAFTKEKLDNLWESAVYRMSGLRGVPRGPSGAVHHCLLGLQPLHKRIGRGR